MFRLIFAFAAVSGLVSVVLGAFGSHALSGRLDQKLLHAYDTGVSYQLSHSLALVVTCLLINSWGQHWALWYAALCYTAGIVLFSGSLYLLALTGIKWVGPVTPLGGLLLIAGWGLLAVGIWQNAPA